MRIFKDKWKFELASTFCGIFSEIWTMGDRLIDSIHIFPFLKKRIKQMLDVFVETAYKGRVMLKKK